MEPFAVRTNPESKASASGQLFDTGYGWPAAVFGVGASDVVPGVVVTVDPECVDKALTTLDAVEGVGSGLFRRALIEVQGHPCWAYQWAGPTSNFRRIALWPPANEQPNHMTGHQNWRTAW